MPLLEGGNRVGSNRAGSRGQHRWEQQNHATDIHQVD